MAIESRRCAQAVLLVVALPGCFPFPHFQQRAPRLIGVVRSAEGPAHGVTVRYAPQTVKGDACDSALSTTTTDGGFEFAAVKEFEFFVIFGDRLDSWGVCVDPDGGSPLRAERRGFWGGPAEVQLDCRLAEPDAGCEWTR